MAFEGRFALRTSCRLFLVSFVVAVIGCRPAERFDQVGGEDALSPWIDTSSTGGTSGTEASCGTGGPLHGSGGSGSGGGSAMMADASVDDGGSGGTALDAGAETVVMDSPPEIGTEHCQSTQWTATASASAGTVASPPAGIDNDLTTRWGNGRFQDGTDWYQVDFSGLVRIDSITLDNSKTYPGDFPGAYSVQGSLDGTTFGGPFIVGTGTEGKTMIQFPPQTVRAIKIKQTGSSRHAFWWQIGELQIHCL